MQQHRELPGDRDQRALLGALAAARGECEAEAPQVTVGAERTQYVLRALHQEPELSLVEHDTQLWLQQTLAAMGATDVKNYHKSWNEYGNDKETPKEKK